MRGTHPTLRLAPLLALLLVGCGKGNGTTVVAPAASPASAADASSALADASPPEDPRVTELWRLAADGGDDDLARLESSVGSEGLTMSSLASPRRRTALRALAFAGDFSVLPFLATTATTGTDEEASDALGSCLRMLAEPRRATDPEDALEIEQARAQLLGLAKDVARPRARRILAVDVLRRLADRGWVTPGDVPTDLDAR